MSPILITGSRAMILAVLMTSTPGFAECIVCDDLVELDDYEATCYLTEFAEIFAVIEAAPNGRSVISLTECAEEQRKRARALDVMVAPKSPGSSTSSKDASFVLDADGALCLYDLIDQAKRPIDPSLVVELSKVCTR